MNTRFVETFVTLARVGSVRRAAAQLHATPGAVSMRVRGLESELGVSLFRRDGNALRITEEGARLLPHAEHLLEAQRALQRASRAGAPAAGRLRLGVLETAVHTFLPAFMKAMPAALPCIEVDLTVDLSVHLTEQLLRRDLDLIVRVADETDHAFALAENLVELPVHWVVRRGLVPARQALRKVLGMQLLTMMRGSVPYEAAVGIAQQLAAQQGMAAADLRVSGSPSLAALVSLVRAGVGVAIMPGQLVKEHLASGELTTLPLPAPPPYRVAAWYLKGAPPLVVETAAALKRCVRQYCRREDEGSVRYIGG